MLVIVRNINHIAKVTTENESFHFKYGFIFYAYFISQQRFILVIVVY